MSNLEIIYFLDNNTIYPFLKKEDETTKRYHEEKKLINNLEKEDILKIKTNNYINFLKEGYSEEELLNKLKEAREKLLDRRNYKGLEEIILEKESLSNAINIMNQEKHLTKNKKITC